MASFSISDFKSNLGGILRPNLFVAKFNKLPNKLSGYSEAGINNTFAFRCERAELPGKSIATIDDVHSGTTTKLAYDLVYSDITLTIIASQDMKERELFEEWMDSIVIRGGEGSGGAAGLVSYYSDYAENSILEISQLRENGDAVATYTLYDIFPIQLSPMNLAWEESNTYQRFTVTMSYRYHTLTIGV
jgi:hypothetical protein